jgi:hypothetical protein
MNSEQIKHELLVRGVVDIPLDPAGGRSEPKLRAARGRILGLQAWARAQWPTSEGITTTVKSDDTGRYLTAWVK